MRKNKNSYAGSVLGFTISIILVALLSFTILRWLDIPVGSLIDWLIGIAIFAWLITVVTVPWNIHFEAKEVLNDAKTSKKLNIQFDEKQLVYVKRLANLSLIGAIFLHLISAVGLYWLSVVNISIVGYFGSGAALLLTLLRPSIRAYEYISERLANIRESITYPREDVYLLKSKVENIESQLNWLLEEMNQKDKDSWRSKNNLKVQRTITEITKIHELLKSFQEQNEQSHERISKETRHAVAQLSEDGKFIDNIVEIIRFIKKV